MIKKSIEDGTSTVAVITGQWGKSWGIGKSIYAMRVAREIGYWLNEDMTTDDSWDYAIKQIVHTTGQLAEVLKEYNYKNRKPILIWDDVGGGGGGSSDYVEVTKYKHLKRTMELIRTRTAGFIMTAIGFQSLAKFLREFGIMEIRITKEFNHRRKATFYQAKTTKKGRRKYVKFGSDMYEAWMPDKWYHKYMEYRDVFTAPALDDIIDLNNIYKLKKEVAELELQKKKKELVNDS